MSASPALAPNDVPPEAQVPKAIPTPFPGTTRSAFQLISGIPTHVQSIFFADKIIITITQGEKGGIPQWFHTPLDTTITPALLEGRLETLEQDELPISHLTPQTLFGIGNSEREAVGQLFAVSIANAIALRRLGESRSVTVGLGLESKSGEVDRETYVQIMELVGKCI